MRTALAYTPRPGRLQAASVGAAAVYLGSFVVLAFAYSSPIVLVGAGCGVVVAGLAAGARAALVATLRWSLTLALLVITVNALVTDRGETILVRGFELPVLGALDVTLESIAAGAVLALRIVIVVMAFGVYSVCVDPDRVLRALRPLAGRSALTASLIARLVPVAAADHVRLAEAATLRGPGAAPAGRAALARRLIAGALDRAVDVAATLELRGYGRAPAPSSALPARRSRHDARFACAGAAIVAGGLVARLLGVGGFEAYPSVTADVEAATLAIAAAVPLVAWVPFAGERGRHARRLARRAAAGEGVGVRA